MIIGVCSDKGAPGVTTLATVLTLLWPGPCVLMEADPSGGDLVFRLHPNGQDFLRSEPTVQSLALAARSGSVAGDLNRYAQATSLGLSVIPGEPQAEEWVPVRGLWPQITDEVSAWPGTVIVDLGRLQPGHSAAVLASRCDVLLLMAHPTVEGLFHVRSRTHELAALLGGRVRNPVGVVVRAGRKQHKKVVDEVTQLLLSVGSPVPVAGWFADDPSGVDALLAGADTAHLRRSALMRSVTELVARLHRLWAIDPPTGPTGSQPRAAGMATQAATERGNEPS